MRSAEMPCGHGRDSTRGSRGCRRRWSTDPAVRFQRDIDSTPPATTRSWAPLATPIAATVIACWPEPQKRFSVMPGTVSGQPASSSASRAMSSPWSPGEDAVAGDHVVDLGGVEPGRDAQRPQALGEQLLRMDAVQRAVGTALASRRAHDVEDPCGVRHRHHNLFRSLIVVHCTLDHRRVTVLPNGKKPTL